MTKLSYAHGSSPTPLTFETIGARFDATAALRPDQEAIVVCDQGVRFTFSELKREVDCFAAGLVACGLRPGDRIGIWSPNNASSSAVGRSRRSPMAGWTCGPAKDPAAFDAALLV